MTEPKDKVYLTRPLLEHLLELCGNDYAYGLEFDAEDFVDQIRAANNLEFGVDSLKEELN